MTTEAKPRSRKTNASPQLLDRVGELRAIIQWARAQKINRLKIGDFEVEFSPAAHKAQYTAPPAKSLVERKIDEENKAQEMEDLLTWSA